jgi:hypothetical protein
MLAEGEPEVAAGGFELPSGLVWERARPAINNVHRVTSMLK